MGTHTAIEWCHHTFNPWWGCTKVAEGCRHCYAEGLDKWLHNGRHWGPGAERRQTGIAYWCQPGRWNQAAAEAGERRRVFCGSMCDVLDPAAPDGQLERLFELIAETPWLDWLLLSKRPERYAEVFARLGCPDNVWAGASASTQAELDQAVKQIEGLPCRVRFLSLEPLIERVDLARSVSWCAHCSARPVAADWRWMQTADGRWRHYHYELNHFECNTGINWVIAGGESGPGARPCDVEWIEQIMTQCRALDVPLFIKQLGRQPVLGGWHVVKLSDPKGGDIEEWADGLRVREVPV